MKFPSSKSSGKYHGFYVYVHRRLVTGEIFYVGKGQGRRAWRHYDRSIFWKRVSSKYGFTVEIVEYGLQEWYAMELECELIALHGRRDCGDGDLTNLTDGGEGCSGTVPNLAQREESSKRMTGLWKDPEVRLRHLESWSDPEVKARYMEARHGLEANQKHSMDMIEIWKDPIYRDKYMKSGSSPETKLKKSISARIAMNDEEVKARHKAAMSSPEELVRKSKAMSTVWATPGYREARKAKLITKNK